MRILILAIPFMGVDEIGKAIAREKEYDFISDPMNLDYYGTFNRHYYHDGNSVVYVEGPIPRPYIFDNSVPDNTIMTHYVGSHKLPKNLNESDFIDQLSVHFDKVVAFTSNNLERQWKAWCAVEQTFTVNRGDFKHYKKLNGASEVYQDSHYNQELVDKIVNGHNILETYIAENGINSVLIQDIARQDAVSEEIDVEIITNKLAVLGINIGPVGMIDANDEVYNARLLATLRGNIIQNY
jgi:hypothetical protein